MELKEKRELGQAKLTMMVLLAAMIFTWVTACWNTPQAKVWQSDSEDLVWGRILQLEKGISEEGGFLGRYGSGEAGYLTEIFLGGELPDDYKWNPYLHQSGLQGTVFGILNALVKPFVPQTELRWAGLRYGNSVLYVFCMMLVCIWVYKKVGFAAAVCAFSCVPLSRYAETTMPNLYWVVWTLLFPLLVSIGACEATKVKGKISPIGVALVGAGVMIKCMCGFELVSGVMVAAELPVILELLQAEKEKRRMWFTHAVWVATAAVAAFVLSMGIWLLQLVAYYGDWALAVKEVLTPISMRIGGIAPIGDLPDSVIESLEKSRLEVVKWYWNKEQFLNTISIKQLTTCSVGTFFPIVVYGAWKRKWPEVAVRQGGLDGRYDAEHSWASFKVFFGLCTFCDPHQHL